MIVKKLIRDIRKTDNGYLIFCTDMQQIKVESESEIAKLEKVFPLASKRMPDQLILPDDMVVVFEYDFFDIAFDTLGKTLTYEKDSLSADEEAFIGLHIASYKPLYVPPPGDAITQNAIRRLVERRWLVFVPADSPDMQSGYKVTEKYHDSTKRKTS